jgi:hypothetical protein
MSEEMEEMKKVCFFQKKIFINIFYSNILLKFHETIICNIGDNYGVG